MPLKLDIVDRKLLAIAGGFFLLLVVLSLLLAPPGQGNEGYPSTWSDAADGGRAAFLLLQSAGYHVEQWQRPPSELPAHAQHAILILAVPFRPSGKDDKEALKLWLARGGSILAVGPEAAGLLPEGNAIPSHGPISRLDWHDVRAVFPGALTHGAPAIHTPSMYVWGEKYPGHVPVYADQGGPVVEWYRYGAGSVIWWADPTPLTNSGLSQPGNLELLLNSLGVAGPPQQLHVYWDEYFHAMPPDFWSTLAIAPLLGGLAQLALIFLLVLWTFSRRQGPLWQPVAAGRLASMEFVDTMGALYSRTRATAVAVEVALERFRFRLTRRLGLDAKAPRELLTHAATLHLRHDPQAFMNLMDQCDQALSPSLAPGDALQLVQRLHDETVRIEDVRP